MLKLAHSRIISRKFVIGFIIKLTKIISPLIDMERIGKSYFCFICATKCWKHNFRLFGFLKVYWKILEPDEGLVVMAIVGRGCAMTCQLLIGDFSVASRLSKMPSDIPYPTPFHSPTRLINYVNFSLQKKLFAFAELLLTSPFFVSKRFWKICGIKKFPETSRASAKER